MVKMAPSSSIEALDNLQTEARHHLAHNIDFLDTLDLCKAFNYEEMHVVRDITCCLPEIASLVDELVSRLQVGGRLIYVGAGNSGRVAWMDCSELPATFSADPSQFLTVIAGGPEAIIQAAEGAEDSEMDGAASLEHLQVTSKDTVIGITASGRTPFVVGALKAALKHRALAAGVTNTRPSVISTIGIKYTISALVGPEFIAGSTRLKAGSATKHILNMVSTCAMIKLGKTYQGLMLDVRVSNEKLKVRGRRIVRQVCEATQPGLLDGKGNNEVSLDLLIKSCNGSIKLASAVAVSGLAPKSAKLLLDQADGHFHIFIAGFLNHLTSEPRPHSSDTELFLAIDGGGSNCTVSIATKSSFVGRATTGPCNLSCVPLDHLVERIKFVTLEALSGFPDESRPPHIDMPRFTKVWAGIAGLYHSYNPRLLASRLEQLFSVSSNDGSLKMTSDDALLESCIDMDNSIDGSIAVITGTGSVATAFKKDSAGQVAQVGRVGGWGHLLGDQGSAFDIGKRGVQSLLLQIEQNQSNNESQKISDLEREVLLRLNCTREGLLSRLLHSSEPSRSCIANLAKVVTELAFRATGPSLEARAILKAAANSLVKVVRPLTEMSVCDPSACSLVLSGALMNLAAYRELFMNEWTREQLPQFQKVVVIDDVSGSAVQFLTRGGGGG